MEKVIQKAIEGGWVAKCCFKPEKNWHWYKGDIFLDPLFWQALGKAMGWGKKMVSDKGVRMRDTSNYYWHHFIDHLASGENADDFFKELCK